MAGYCIYSLDWDKFRGFVESPGRDQLLTFGGLISAALDEFDDRIEEGDPLQDWPSQPDPLGDLARLRLLQPDWYGDLSDPGKAVWERALTGFCEKKGPKGFGFRVESDGVYWDVIGITGEHHGLPPLGNARAILGDFGSRPYRYHPPADRVHAWEDWSPTHSMHTPEDVHELLEELKAAGPTIRSSPRKGVRHDFEAELLPAVEKVARDGRLLYIAVDT